MKNINLKDLRPLTIITGDSFSGKTKLIKEIARETSNSKYIDIDSVIGLEVTKDLKHWFKFVFGIDFIQPAKYTIDSNYILRILSVGLDTKDGDILVVGNPEILLHPKTISNIAKFFVYLVSKKGVKVVIETNSTDFVTSICYEVYSRNIDSNDIIFFNKTRDNIEKINVGNSGKFVDENGNLRKYPSGFFDANSAELYSLL